MPARFLRWLFRALFCTFFYYLFYFPISLERNSLTLSMILHFSDIVPIEFLIRNDISHIYVNFFRKKGVLCVALTLNKRLLVFETNRQDQTSKC